MQQNLAQSTLVLGLGSNLGDRLLNILRGVEELSSGPEPVLSDACVSPLYESAALLPDNGQSDWDLPFYNLAISGRTSLEPSDLLEYLRTIEEKTGRREHKRWSPRELDIDILVWGDLFLESEGLSIPHKELHKRPFAVWPLADLVPQWRFPEKSARAGKKSLEVALEYGSRFVAAPWRDVLCNTVRASAEKQRVLREKVEEMGLTFEEGYTFGASLVGILNLTPDSFSGDALGDNCDLAVSRALSLFAEGAKVIDIGGESTRPGALAVEPDEEWRRLHPVLKTLFEEFRENRRKPLISLDSRHPQVLEKALNYGVDWINDVSGARDLAMADLALQAGLSYVVMHSLSVPVVKGETLPLDSDPLYELTLWANTKISELLERGFRRDKIIIDPGLGFGKSPAQSKEIVMRVNELGDAGCDILVGHSRKSFMSLFSSEAAEARDLETALLSPLIAEKGVKYLRVHNIKDSLRALRAYSVMRY